MPGACQRTGSAPPPTHTPRTKWTRRVPHPVLIGHAASPRAAPHSIPSVMLHRPAGPLLPSSAGRCSAEVIPEPARCSGGAERRRKLEHRPALICSVDPPRASGRHRVDLRRTGGSGQKGDGNSARTIWTRLVPPSVLTGHVQKGDGNSAGGSTPPPSLPYYLDTSRPSFRTNWTRPEGGRQLRRGSRRPVAHWPMQRPGSQRA